MPCDCNENSAALGMTDNGWSITNGFRSWLMSTYLRGLTFNILVIVYVLMHNDIMRRARDDTIAITDRSADAAVEGLRPQLPARRTWQVPVRDWY